MLLTLLHIVKNEDLCKCHDDTYTLEVLLPEVRRAYALSTTGA